MLATMPLHAITEVYGERGLRERFILEIEPFPPGERERLMRAMELAATLHAGQRRVRESYLNHVLRVAIRIIHYYGVRDVDVIVAALLHDSAEDQAERLAGVPDTGAALAKLAELFGPRVAGLVESVTNPDYTPDRSEHEQYREHVAEALEHDPWARVIKVSDFTDNGVGVIHTTGPKVNSSARKYRPLVPVFRDFVTRPDTPLDDAVKAHILDQLTLAEERFAAILDSEEDLST
jgi:HD domain